MSLEKAAAHVQDGLEGRDAHGRAFAMTAPLLTRFCFGLNTNDYWTHLTIGCMLLRMLLCLLESSLSRLTFVGLFVACVVIVTVDMLLKMQYMGVRGFLSKPWQQIHFFIVCAGVLELIGLAGALQGLRVFQVMRLLHPALIITRSREVRRVWTASRSMLSQLYDPLAVFMFLWLSFTAVGSLLFGDLPEFRTLTAAGISLFSLLSADGLAAYLSHSLTGVLFFSLYLVRL